MTQATYPRVDRSGPLLLPYLVLLRVGFALPAESLRPRCALTAPFHPYPTVKPGGLFSVALSVKPGLIRAPPAVSRHVALWRPDFPPRNRGDCLSGKLPFYYRIGRLELRAVSPRPLSHCACF